jgi:iron(III) transport system permease protein
VIVVGVATAWLTAMHDFPGRRSLRVGAGAAAGVPAYVMAYTYTDFLQFVGPVQTAWLRESFGWSKADYWFPDVRSLGGAVAMFVFVLYPYVYLLARTAFSSAPAACSRSRTLGLGPGQLLPRLAAAGAAGRGGRRALALMETLADYGTVSYFGVQTFTTGIYRAWFSLGDRIAAAQLAAALLAFVILCCCSSALAWPCPLSQHHPAPPPAAAGAAGLPRLAGHRWPAPCRWHRLSCCRRPAAAAGADRSDDASSARFRHPGAQQLLLAALTALIAVAWRCCWPTAPAWRAAGAGAQPPGRPGLRRARLGDRRRRADSGDPPRSLAGRLAAVVRRNPGLLLTGGIAALVYAYLVRFLAVGLQSVGSSLAKITPSMDDAARSLGLGQARPAPGAPADPARQPAHGLPAGVRRCDEGAAGHAGDASLQLRHAGHAGLHAGVRRAPGGSVSDRRGLAIVGGRVLPADRQLRRAIENDLRLGAWPPRPLPTPRLLPRPDGQ